MSKINKSDLISNLKDDFGLSHSFNKEVVDFIIADICRSLKNGEKVTINGFGTFKVKNSPSKQVRHPKTALITRTKGGKNIKFYPSKSLKILLNNSHE